MGLALSLDSERKIEFIICKKELVYQAYNLIGISVLHLIDILESMYVGDADSLMFEEDGIPQMVYEFESHGLQAWVKNGLIVAIIVAEKD